MRGLDYRWVEALDAVIEQGSFERGAQLLCITQSAISQRVKQLEKFMGQAVLVREQPPYVTPAGQKLLGLYQRVKLLEQDLLPELEQSAVSGPIPVAIASNADSLASWLLPALKPLLLSNKLLLKLQLADEAHSLDKLRSGEVVGAISIEPCALSGCLAEYLGRIDFIAVASPDYIQRYFSQGVNPQTLRRAPGVVFDQHDQINAAFLQQHFSLDMSELSTHVLRSSDAFVRSAKLGVAYSIIPAIQVEQELRCGELVNICPELRYHRELYWHHWALEGGVLAELTQQLKRYANCYLPQSAS